MNDEVIIDLKQFIAATMSQEIQLVTDRIDKLEQKVDDLSTFVVEALDIANETAGEQFKGHERRITKLEAT